MTLLGPSGCGKTTLLRIIAGFVQPDEGDVLLDGIDIKHLRPNKRPTGMVFQSYALFPHMNVNENIAFGLRMHRFEKGDMKKRIDQVMELRWHCRTEGSFPVATIWWSAAESCPGQNPCFAAKSVAA